MPVCCPNLTGTGADAPLASTSTTVPAIILMAGTFFARSVSDYYAMLVSSTQSSIKTYKTIGKNNFQQRSTRTFIRKRQHSRVQPVNFTFPPEPGARIRCMGGNGFPKARSGVPSVNFTNSTACCAWHMQLPKTQQTPPPHQLTCARTPRHSPESCSLASPARCFS
jgi:hypothetical protein